MTQKLEPRPDDPLGSLQPQGRLRSCSRDPKHKGKPCRVTYPNGRELMVCEKCADAIGATTVS